MNSPHFPIMASSSTCPTAISCPIRPPQPLACIDGRWWMKKEGEILTTSIIFALMFWWVQDFLCLTSSLARPPNTQHHHPTPSDRRIPSNTSTTGGERNMKVRSGKQVHLLELFRWLTSHISFHYLCHLVASFTCPTAKLPLTTHRSPRINWRWGGTKYWNSTIDCQGGKWRFGGGGNNIKICNNQPWNE
jgi:hypothetical protein